MPFILGSGNVRFGLAQQDAPFSIPHCIARRTTGSNQSPRRNVQDQVDFVLLGFLNFIPIFYYASLSFQLISCDVMNLPDA